MSSIALQLTYVKSYTHYLTVVELGYCFYLTALSYSINAFILVPADFYQQARLSVSYQAHFPLGAVLSLNKRLLLVAAAFTLLFGVPIWIAGKINPFDLLLVFALAVSFYLSTSTRNYLNNRGHNLFTGWMLLLEAFLKVSSFLLFLWVGMSHVNAFVLSTVIAFLVEALCLARFFYLRVPFNSKPVNDFNFASMVKMSSTVSLSSVCNWVQLQGYRIVYVWLGLAEVAGLYAAVSNLGTLGMNACSTVFSQMLLPRVYSSKGAYIFQYLKCAVLLCIVVVIGYLAFGKILLSLLTKKEFEPYAPLMIFGILVEAGNLLIGAASTYFTIRQRPLHLVAANIVGLLAAALGFCMCLLWHPRSYYWLGAVLAISQVVVCANLFFRANKDFSSEVIHV
jgi:O-antigen/teichoic acid export membrane protein